MGQRPRRGKSEYFDLKLVELVEGLWKSAATVQDGRAMLFPKTSNNKLRPGKVRELFKIDENYYSAWKFNDWKKLGAHQPRTFAETLAIVFRGGDYSDDFPNDEVLRINLLHRHWQQYCTNELQLVQVALTRHLVTCERPLQSKSMRWSGNQRDRQREWSRPELSLIRTRSICRRRRASTGC